MDGFNDPQQKELKALFEAAGEKHKAVVKTEVQAALAGVVTTKDLEKQFTDLGIAPGTIEKILKAVETQGLELRKMFEQKPGVVKSIGELLHEAKDSLTKLANNELKSFKMHIKNDNVNKTLVERSAVGSSTQALRIGGIAMIDHVNPVIRSLFGSAQIGADSNGVIRYVDQTTATRNADNKAEGSEAPESVVAWTERTASLQKIMDSIPVTMEAFRDVAFIESEINTLLNVNMTLKEDQQLYAGTGVAPQLKGLNVSAAAADLSAFAASVGQANVYDVIAAIRVAMMNGNVKYNPNYVLMNPADIFKYKVLKGADGHYLLPPFVGPNGETIMGMRVVETSQVTADTLNVIDSRFGTIYDDGGIELEMGYVDDQFTKDTMTIKARKRTLLLIRTANEGGFKKVASIAAEVAALTA